MSFGTEVICHRSPLPLDPKFSHVLIYSIVLSHLDWILSHQLVLLEHSSPTYPDIRFHDTASFPSVYQE